MTEPASDRVVAVAFGDYATLPELQRAVPDAQDLVDLLTRHDFDGRVLANVRRGPLLDEIDDVLAAGSAPKGSLVLLWTGHGVLGADGRLRLWGQTKDGADGEVTVAAMLGEWAARTGAAQILVLLDCCFSGGAVPETTATAGAVFAGRADTRHAWFACVAASRGDEPARCGALSGDVKRLLTDGPADEELRKAWVLNPPKIPGDRLIEALGKEWSEPRQFPTPSTYGFPLPMLPNPLYRAGSRHAVVEHLLHAARGTSTDENFFTGRDEILTRIVTWMSAGEPGLCVVTGPAGSGKSAIVGRVVSLSVPEERELIGQRGPANADPGESSVDATVQLRNVDLKIAVAGLARELDLPDDSGIYDVFALAGRRRRDGSPLVIVFDGLDEAGDLDSRDIAVQLVTPLSREALVLVGTRDAEGPVGEPGLLALLAPAAETIDLAAEVEATLRDVRAYSVSRLRGVSPKMDPELVADELLSSARAANPAREGPFLFVRLVTSQLRASPVDTDDESWRQRLASSVEAAFEADLKSCVLEIDGRQHPTAARELMLALACAHGGGFPADDVWPAVATALSPTGSKYTRDSTYALLFSLGRHVVTGREGDQAVFRIAHRRLVEHLRPTVGEVPFQTLAPIVAEPVAEAVSTLYQRLLDGGQEPTQHAYLWRFTWRHLADAGMPGLALMRHFVARDREAFLPDLAAATMAVAARSLGWGRAREAATIMDESVEIYRELDDGIELAGALSQLAIARSHAGDSDEAEEAADQALVLIRRLKDEPHQRAVLANALVAQAVGTFRQGNPAAAGRLATEAIEILEAEVADGNTNVGALGDAYAIASTAACLTGDAEQADKLSQHALEILDQNGVRGYLLVEALTARTQAEFLCLQAARLNAVEPPQLTAGMRLVELYRESGATGQLSDVMLAEGFRLFALSIILVGAEDGELPTPRELLDDAIALLAEKAEESWGAALSLGTSLLARALLPDAGEPGAQADLEAAEHALGRFAAVSSLVAAALGIVIGRQVELRAAGGEVDLNELISRQTDAVEFLSRGADRQSRVSLCSALRLLYVLLMQSDRTDEAVVVAEELVNRQREVLDGSAVMAVNAAGALAELSGMVTRTRPVEAIELATEALTLLQAVPPDQYALIRGQAELNRGSAYLLMERPADARPSLERAITVLESESGAPALAWLLATALSNITLILISDGEPERALESARRAMALYGEYGAGPNPLSIPSARVHLASALRATGDEPAAMECLSTAVAEMQEQVRTRNDTVGALAEALNLMGASGWQTSLEALEDRRDLVEDLSLLRIYPDEHEQDVFETIRIAVANAGEDRARLRRIHQFVRARRNKNPREFDAACRDAGQPIEGWMAIPQSLELAVHAWVNSPTWPRERDYLRENQLVLDERTDILLEELRDESGDTAVDTHLKLRSEAAAHGVDAAYAPILANLLLEDWFGAGLDGAFLAEHFDDLFAPAVTDVLAARVGDGEPGAVVAHAVLVLARRGEQHVAYRIDEDESVGIAMLEPAWRSADMERLAAIATLCRESDQIDKPDQRLATVALAIAYALSDRHDEALVLARQLTGSVDDEGDRAGLLAAVSDALAHHQDQADSLIELLSVLGREAESPSGCS